MSLLRFLFDFFFLSFNPRPGPLSPPCLFDALYSMESTRVTRMFLRSQSVVCRSGRAKRLGRETAASDDDDGGSRVITHAPAEGEQSGVAGIMRVVGFMCQCVVLGGRKGGREVEIITKKKRCRRLLFSRRRPSLSQRGPSARQVCVCVFGWLLCMGCG